MNPETIIHLSIVKYLTLLENQRRLFFFHPANGGARTAREGALLKRMGVKPGVADLLICRPGGKVAFVEIKSGKGRESISQKETAERIRSLGFEPHVVRSLDEMIALCEGWGLVRVRAAP